jgi:hypothetical protein
METRSRHLLSLADLGRETSLDGRDGSSRATVVASDEVQTVFSLIQLGVGRLAGLASDILDDVFSDHVLDLLLLEATLDDQSPATVDGTVGTQLSEEVSRHVLLSTLHALADVGNVGKNGLPVAFTHTLGWGDLVALGSAEGVVGVLLRELAEEALEKHVVVDGLGLVVCPDAGTGVHVTAIYLLSLDGLVLVLDLELL